MAEWSVDAVAARFVEAAETSHRLPSVRVQGYFNVWPEFVRREWETLANEDREYRPLPPSPSAVDRMLETMRWVQWLEEEQRHLVWMRAERHRWEDIARRFGCVARTAQRRWDSAMQHIVQQLDTGNQ